MGRLAGCGSGRGWRSGLLHSTGHGVGLEIHEGPRIAKKLPDTPKAKAGSGKAAVETLKSGMIATL